MPHGKPYMGILRVMTRRSWVWHGLPVWVRRLKPGPSRRALALWGRQSDQTPVGAVLGGEVIVACVVLELVQSISHRTGFGAYRDPRLQDRFSTVRPRRLFPPGIQEPTSLRAAIKCSPRPCPRMTFPRPPESPTVLICLNTPSHLLRALHNSNSVNAHVAMYSRRCASPPSTFGR